VIPVSHNGWADRVSQRSRAESDSRRLGIRATPVSGKLADMRTPLFRLGWKWKKGIPP
jgi:hypothetical protein